MVNYKRSVIIKVLSGAIFLAAVVIGVWLLFMPSIQQEATAPNRAAERKTESFTETDSEKPADTDTTDINPEKLLEASPKLQKLKQIQTASNRESDFFIKVVDQHGESVQGAIVEYAVTRYGEGVLPSFSATPYYAKAVTDAEGKMALRNLKGISTHIRSISKPGYIFGPGVGPSNVYRFTLEKEGEERYVADVENPVVITGWKKGYAAKELKRGEGLVTPMVNGEPRILKFPETEETVSVTFAHLDDELADEGRGERRWVATIEVRNGGIIAADDAFMYEAPETGYQSSIKVSGTDSEWINKRFYLKALNGGIYGRIEVDMTGYYGPDRNRGAMDIKYVLNPTGSRNLLSEND